MFFNRRAGWWSWRPQRAMLAVATVMTLGAIYQALVSRDATSVWLPLAFVSQTSAAMESESSNLDRPTPILSPSSSGGLSSKNASFRNSQGAPAPAPAPAPSILHFQEGDGNGFLKVISRSPKQKAAFLSENSRFYPGPENATTSANGSTSLIDPYTEDSKARESSPRGFDEQNVEVRNDSNWDILNFNSSESIEVTGLVSKQSQEKGNKTAPLHEGAGKTKSSVDVICEETVLPKDRIVVMEGNSGTFEKATDTLSRSGAAGATDIVQLPLPAAEDDVRSPISSPAAKKPAWLLKLERDLQEAKETISHSSIEEDFDLYGPIYRNVSAFKKSYELMDKIFRVYMYKEGTRPLVHVGPTVGIYSSEGRFIHGMEHNRHFITKNPEEAHMFFLPFSVTNMVIELYVPNSQSMLPIATFIKGYVNTIAAKYPFWNRTGGADHFYISCHDWGLATARDHQQLRQNAIKVVCNADLTDGYVLKKDVSLPEIYLHSAKPPRRLGGPGPGRRRYLAFFAGQMHGRVRPVLLKHWKGRDPDMRIFEVLPSSNSKKTSYVQYMKLSKYCICAMGYEVNSPRIVEAIYYDCVPVIIADNFVLPFSDVLKWDAFSVTVQERDIPGLKDILLKIPDKEYRLMQNRLKNVRQHFLWHESPVKYDVFHMILHSVWIRRLSQVD